MAGVKNSKLKLLYLAEIFEKKTDENNYISATQICDELAKLDIPAERKSIYKDIDILREYGYDIIHTGSRNGGGYFLGERKFQLAEIRLLSDAVQAASFITVKKTRELVRKLDSMLSEGERRKREKGIYIDNGHKCENEEIYYNIDTLSRAVALKKKVTLTYIIRQISEDRKLFNVNKEYCTLLRNTP